MKDKTIEIIIAIGVGVLFLLVIFFVIPQITKDKPTTSNGDKSPLQNYTNTVIKFNELNYTTLNISREEFENLLPYQQTDWLSGICSPEDCKRKNPPVCVGYHAVYCYNPESEENKYFDNIYVTSLNEDSTQRSDK